MSEGNCTLLQILDVGWVERFVNVCNVRWVCFRLAYNGKVYDK
jgi:hypothetical protein